MANRSWMLLFALVFTGCVTGGDSAPVDAGRGDAPNYCLGRDEGTICAAGLAVTCDAAEGIVSEVACVEPNAVCVPGIGCAACAPGAKRCAADGSAVETCSDDGSGYVATDTCEPVLGEACDVMRTRCVTACQRAREERAYEGCEYWPVTLMNSLVRRDFTFAVAVGNGNSVPAQIRVDRRGATVAEATVAPGSTQVVELLWVDALKQSFLAESSAFAPGGAYRVTSSVPVTVYQFSPLQYRLPYDCPGEGTYDNQCFSFTNDASLLLPTTALSPNYIVSTWPSRMTRGLYDDLSTTSPGFVAIVGVEPGSTSVQVRFKAHTLADFEGVVDAYAPGETGTFMLERGDVLQLASAYPATCEGDDFELGNHYCAIPREYDLTGTEVEATGSVAVFGGHNCAFVPSGRYACDHLEEMLPPLEAWGTQTLVSRTQPLRDEPNILRILAGRDDTVVTFSPPIFAPITLDRGEFRDVEIFEHVGVESTGPVLVTQFLVGQDFGGLGTSGRMGLGDPSMALASPAEQFRRKYTFLVPDSYEQNHISVIARLEQPVTLDGAPLTGFVPIGNTGYGAAAFDVGGGVHTLEAAQPAGLLIYGFGQYTSYAFSGGLDLRLINEPF